MFFVDRHLSSEITWTDLSHAAIISLAVGTVLSFVSNFHLFMAFVFGTVYFDQYLVFFTTCILMLCLSIPIARICTRIGLVKAPASLLVGSAIGGLGAIVGSSILHEMSPHTGFWINQDPIKIFARAMVGVPLGVVYSSIFWLALHQRNHRAFGAEQAFHWLSISIIAAGIIAANLVLSVISLLMEDLGR